MNCEEWVFCNVYDGGINMMFDEFCGSKRDARFGIGESKPMEGLLEGLSGRISLSFSGAASSRHGVRECKGALGGDRGCKTAGEHHGCAW